MLYLYLSISDIIKYGVPTVGGGGRRGGGLRTIGVYDVPMKLEVFGGGDI